MENIKKFEPRFIGMKKEDIYCIKHYENYIKGYDEKGNLVYKENKNGKWERWEYNEYKKEVYYENSKREWRKTEYKEYTGKLEHLNYREGCWKSITVEEIKGVIIKTEYNEHGQEVLCKKSNGEWRKTVYEDGKPVYYEDSNDYWEKTVYKYINFSFLKVYYTNSNGVCKKWEYNKNGDKTSFSIDLGYCKKWDYNEFGDVIGCQIEKKTNHKSHLLINKEV